VHSNRRVPHEILGGLEGDEPARAFIMEQDREIAEKGGRPALPIKRIERVGAKKKCRAAGSPPPSREARAAGEKAIRIAGPR
jgi:hypothetical protein